MKPRQSFLLTLSGLFFLGVSPQLRGETPQVPGRRPVLVEPRPVAGDLGSVQRPGLAQDARDARPLRPRLPAAPPGRPPIMRPAYTRLDASASFAYLPAFQRCMVMPDAAYWATRDYDLMAAIQREARHGFIPVTPFPVDQDTVTGTSMVASGWRAYGFVVPPGGMVQLKLSHPNPAWFKVYWVDQWGEYRPGMMIKPGEPEALYTNSGKKPSAVYAIVDDPGQWATNASSAFTLTAKRNFDAAHLDADGVTVHQGIWNIAPETYWLSPAHR